MAHYGRWPSAISPAQMATQGRRYGFVTFDAQALPAWCELRPHEGGRVVVCRLCDDGQIEDLTPADFNARTRVHEYGGRPYVFDGAVLWCASFDDQRLARIERGVVTLRSTGEGWRFAEPIVDVHRNRIIAVAERHTSDTRYPRNGLAAVDRTSGDVRWLVEQHDFVSSPALSPDARTLAYIAWEHPYMRWDAAALYVAAVHDDGRLGPSVHVAGGINGSVNECQWCDDGALLFTLEVNDRWQPYLWRDGAAHRVADVPGELGAPMWNVGTATMALSGEVLLCVAQHDGVSTLMRVDVRTGACVQMTCEVPHLGALAARGSALAAVGGFNGAGLAVLYTPDGSTPFRVIAGAIPGGPLPDAISFATDDGEVAHGFLHMPWSPTCRAPEGTLPPLLVTAHGGPTGAASALSTLALQFWTSRGFAVLDVNYRGSSGFGRAYRERLRGAWGVIDVADCVRGAQHLIATGRVRGDAVFIRGASAGGFTVLQALCNHAVFHAGACLFGVSDPRVLMAETHKLESHYEHFLFGEGEAREEALRTRAPLHHPERIGVPVVFFHGTEDLAVPPSQSERLHVALKQRGIASELYLYPGEQHGFRKAETVIDVHERELAFYLRML